MRNPWVPSEAKKRTPRVLWVGLTLEGRFSASAQRVRHPKTEDPMSAHPQRPPAAWLRAASLLTTICLVDCAEPATATPGEQGGGASSAVPAAAGADGNAAGSRSSGPPTTGGLTSGGEGGSSSSAGGTSGLNPGSSGNGGQLQAGAAGSGGMPQAEGGSKGLAGAPSSGCTPGLALCEDFESGSIGNAWELSADGGTAKVESGFAYRGGHSLHIHLDPGETTEGQVYVTTTAVPHASRTIHVRAFMYLTPEAPDGHGSFLELSGTKVGGGEAMYAAGYQFRRFMGNFVNWQPFSELVTECKKAGGPCNQADAEAALVPIASWHCVEWTLDGAAGLNTQISVNGSKLTLDNYGTPSWPKMESFAELLVGMKSYWGQVATDLWLDELAVSNSAIGCQ